MSAPMLEDPPASQNRRLKADDPTVIVLSSSLLTDRMFRYSGFTDVLAANSKTHLWATSVRNPENQDWCVESSLKVEPFPQIQPFKEFPYNYLRRLNDYVWDYSQQPPSRISMMRHVRDKSVPFVIRALKAPARAIAMVGGHSSLENRVERLLLTFPRSVEASERLRQTRPAVVVTTGPFQFDQPAVVAAAKNLGIPVMAMIPSWDNVSTKNRMVFKYDGYLVWSKQTRDELHYFYPQSRKVPIYVVGASQFDVFFQPRFQRDRREFGSTLGLNADLPIIVYAVGSPNFLAGEKFGALDLAERIDRGELGDVQLVIRPHPIHDNAEMAELFRRFSKRIILQRTAKAGTPLTARSQSEDKIVEWVNTFRHADVVVNLSSTVTIDAAIFDRPVVNLDYDCAPGQPHQQLVREINHHWTHFKPVAESGGVWLVNNSEEMVAAVREYLRHPELHRERRRWMAEYVCGYLDGRCGERTAEAILDFCKQRTA